MRAFAITTAVAAVTLALPALAQNVEQTDATGTPAAGSSSNQVQRPAGMHQANHAAIEQHIRADLTKAGFTDIHVMPESFLVRAKNSQGMPVMMVINPDSVTAVTAMGSKGGSSSGNPGGGTPSVGGSAGGTTSQ